MMFIGSLTVSAAQEGDYTYTTDGTSSTITKYTGPGGAVTIPATLGGLPTSTIGTSAFYNIQTITSVAIPSSVTLIGTTAFDRCYHLSSVSIPEGVVTIGAYSFFDCASLTQVSVPASTTLVGSYAFSGCTSLQSIDVAIGNLHYSTSGGSLYKIAGDILIQYPAGRAGTFTVPLSIISITNYALADSIALTSIDVDPSHPTYASLDGVLYDKSMTYMLQYPAGKVGAYVMPSTVTTVSRYGFIGSHGLTSATIASGVTAITHSSTAPICLR